MKNILYFLKYNDIVRTRKKCYNKFKNGYIALLSVLSLGAVGIALTVSLIFLGIGFSRSSSSLEYSQKAKGLANACAEEGLNKLQANTNYTGTGTVTLGSHSCGYTVSNTGGVTRSVSASATANGVTRKVLVNIDAISPNLNISQWQEVAN